MGDDPVDLVDPWGLLPPPSILWRNRNFILHYFFGFGKPMEIVPNSDLGHEITNHIKNIMDKRYQEAISHANEYCSYETKDHVDFTNNPDLFSIGDSILKTRVFCGNGRCLIRFEIRDWFRDARDIYDTMRGYQEYPFGVPYQINFTAVYTYGF